MNKVKKYLKNPRLIIPSLGARGFFHHVSDERYLKWIYKARIGEKLNLENPITYNEKLQWLKIHNRNPLCTMLADKYLVRNYIKNKIGEEYLIPLLGVWDKFDDLDFGQFPNEFVLKCNHNSDGVIICKDKADFDKELARKRMNKWMNRNYFWGEREWPYKDIEPRIIAEKYMVDESGVELKDYKFFCFDGQPQALFVATERQIDTKFDFFDIEFNHLPFTNGYENASREIVKPAGYDKMVEISRILSEGFPHVRVDLYDIRGRVYFGELTFYHWSGLTPFNPKKWDKSFGDWIKLPIE